MTTLKNTGMVRRIDDLGRIVIPKEIRKTLRLGEGDFIEIFVSQNNEIILKRHSTINDVWSFANDYLSCLYRFLNLPIFIFDTDKVIIAKGKNKDELLTLTVEKKLEVALRKKHILKATSISDNFFNLPNDLNKYLGEFIVPIISNGDVIGGICCLSVSDLKESDENLIKVASSFIGKYLE